MFLSTSLVSGHSSHNNCEVNTSLTMPFDATNARNSYMTVKVVFTCITVLLFSIADNDRDRKITMTQGMSKLS